jgi:hypothetical protein
MVKISTALALCVTLFSAACVGRRESSFFSNFSIRTLVEQNKSSAGLACDPNGGGGGGEIGTSSGGFGLGRTRFSSHKGDSFACSLKSDAVEGFSETRLISALRSDVERSLRDNGAQITESGNIDPSSFYFAYTLKNVQGRIQVSGKRIRANYYDLHAQLDETGN